MVLAAGHPKLELTKAYFSKGSSKKFSTILERIPKRRFLDP
jgi:hypothetical protein